MEYDFVYVNGRFATLDAANRNAEAVAVKDGLFAAVGSEADIRAGLATGTRIVDLKGRRVIPGLIDSHMHVIRGGLSYNLELRWDGVRSLADDISAFYGETTTTRLRFAHEVLSTRPEINVFLAARIGAVLRWSLSACGDCSARTAAHSPPCTASGSVCQNSHLFPVKYLGGA